MKSVDEVRSSVLSVLSEVRVEGKVIKKGDWIGFKADVEQSARVVRISGNRITVEAPEDGFEGSYIRGQDFYTLQARDAWLESVDHRSDEVTEAAYHAARMADINKAAVAAARTFTNLVAGKYGSLDPADAREIESDIQNYLIKASDRAWKIK